MNFYYFCIMKIFVRNIAIFVTLLVLCGCANVVSPSGGPKDDKAPVVLEASPANNSTNFKGRSIHLTFDEFVTLNNPSNTVLISPPMNKKPTYRTSGKTVIIRFEEPLRPNTTYSINFGDAIKDLHENNVFSGYTFNFSTGDIIDSLSLKGSVISASTLKPDEGFYVALYSDDNDTVTLDSLPYKVKPNYITTTDKNGEFQFSGLADKEYLIFALDDNNSNMVFDLPNEEIAFYPDLVRPYFIENKIVSKRHNDTIQSDSLSNNDSVLEIKNSEFTSYELFSFVQEDSIQKIFKKELVEAGLLRFAFRYPTDNVSITPLEELPDTFNIMSVYLARKDTVLWYFTPTKDSLWISINDGANISDTTHYSLKPRESVSRWRRNQEENKAKSLTVKNNLKSGKLKPYQPLILSFNEPVTMLNEHDTTWFIADKDTILNDLHFVKVDEYGFKYQLAKELAPEMKYQILVPDSTFFGFRGLTNDTIQLSFGVQEESAFGNVYLTVEVHGDLPQVIIELLTEQGKVVEKHILTKSGELAFEYLDPGKYKLKATLDQDANCEWSPGNFAKRLQPEKIVFYNGTLEVRANWDIDLDEPWKIEK